MSRLPSLLLAGVCVVAGVTPLSAQEDAPSRFASIIDASSDVAGFGRMNFTMRTRVAALQDCTLQLSVASSTSSGRASVEPIVVQLGTLAPAPTVKKWEDHEIWSVQFRTSDFGRHVETTNGLGEPMMANRFEVSFPDSVVAHRAADIGTQAITSCGGQDFTEAGLAGLAAEAAQEEIYSMLQERCRRLVGPLLVDPDHATYTPTMGSELEGVVNVTGRVASLNRMGGRVEKYYSCRFRRAGESWTPASPPMIY